MKEALFIILVTGKVQGVFFRKHTREKAEELGLSGFVRNESDGSVYIEAQGEVLRLQALLDWCRTGPPQAKVDNVEYREEDPKDHRSFLIVR